MGEKLSDKTDAELVSLIGQANAIISDRARARNREFQTAVGRCNATALHAGKFPTSHAALPPTETPDA